MFGTGRIATMGVAQYMVVAPQLALLSQVVHGSTLPTGLFVSAVMLGGVTQMLSAIVEISLLSVNSARLDHIIHDHKSSQGFESVQKKDHTAGPVQKVDHNIPKFKP
ncbi:hypothetical protein OAT84_00195 [Gammaproteobacteria bacterium]|nr:hypothetical protein [Gammaproteobacteria bacterium]